MTDGLESTTPHRAARANGNREIHQSLWNLRTPSLTDASHVAPLPPHADVVIVGAGITGTTLALLLANRGLDVVVVDAHRVAGGTTGSTTAKVTVLHGARYHSMLGDHGAEIAKAYADANLAGLDVIRELATGLALPCDLQVASAYTYTTDQARREELEAECVALRSVGIDAVLVDSTEIDDAVLAVQVDAQLMLDPRRYVRGLVTSAQQRGVQFVEHTVATSVEPIGDAISVNTSRGNVLARDVVVTTLLPAIDHGGYFARATPVRSYAIAFEGTASPMQHMHLSIDDPTRSVRPYRAAGGRPGLIVGGDGHRTGTGPPEQQHYDALLEWTRSRWPEAREVTRWSAQDYEAIDGLPFVGRQPRHDHLWVAGAFAKWGMTNGTAAALMLDEALAGDANPWAFAFDAQRLGNVRSVGRTMVENVGTIGGRWLGGHLRRVFRGDTSPTCTHMGCKLRRNEAEDSWDCACHGSRFATDGIRLEGVATRDLPSPSQDRR